MCTPGGEYNLCHWKVLGMLGCLISADNALPEPVCGQIKQGCGYGRAHVQGLELFFDKLFNYSSNIGSGC